MNFDWIESIPDYISYFNDDHQLIIKKIGLENYIKLFNYFGKTGVYFPVRQFDDSVSDKNIVIELIGVDNYNKLYESFSKSGIYFSNTPITQLKKTWVNLNKHIDYKTAARKMDTSLMSIYRWRSQDCGANE